MKVELTRTDTGFPHLIVGETEIPITDEDYDKLKRELDGSME